MLKQYLNYHLIEVNCGFQFTQETIAWDSTFFGQYYEKIKDTGFNAKEERKGVQITFRGTKGSVTEPITSSEVEDQVIFKNNEKGWAIAMGRNRISFHVVKNYTNWADFLTNFITPYFTYYKDLGLGNGIRQCNIVYLNRFIKPINEKLSDYFTIISPIDEKFGLETITSLQRIIENDTNLLVAKINSQILQDKLNVNFECGAICKSIVCMNNKDWTQQANQTHDPIKDFFESLITQKLRNEL